MKWDAHYQQGVDMTFNEAVTRMKAQCPDWQNPWDPVLLLLNKPLPDAQAEGFQLLYQTPARPWGERDEFFYLYAPTSFTPESVAPNRRSEPRPRSAC